MKGRTDRQSHRLLNPINFTPRWKELLDVRTPWGNFTIELTMGAVHVYYPDEAKWQKDVPAPLQTRWGEIHGELQCWCESQKIPLSIVSDAWIEFHGE